MGAVPDEDEPRWFYVGNGQLRRKDSNGWTDEYQDLDGPKRAAEADGSESAEVPDTPVVEAGPGWGARVLSSLGRLCAIAARWLIGGLRFLLVGLWRLVVGLGRLIAKGYRLASESRRTQPRRGRHRSGAHPDVGHRPAESETAESVSHPPEADRRVGALPDREPAV